MPPCRFHNTPSGCKFGDKCSFSHSGSSRPSQATRPPRPPNNNNQENPNAPPGICNFYWSRGTCNREFNCKYRHERSTSAASSSRSAHPPMWRDATASNASPTKDMSPTEMHRRLKRFLQDDFRFRRPIEVYPFVSLLSSINVSDSAWTEAAPLLLTSLAQDNGLLRINDVLRWEEVSTRVALNGQALSFKRGFFPLLKFYASDLVIKSTLHQLVNGLYQSILDNFEPWSTNLTICMRHIIETGSFGDTSESGTDAKSIGIQLFTSLVKIFYEILTRFKNVSIRYPTLPEVVHELRQWVEAWVDGVTASPPSFTDAFTTLPVASRDHIVQHLRGQITRIVAIVDREQRRMDQKQSSPFIAPRQTHSQEGLSAALRAIFETEGPGALRIAGPRHDNDSTDIAEIKIAPTHGELVSLLLPFLPANYHGAPHHLPTESMERLLDIQFRLLREELTSSLRSAVQLVRNDLIQMSPQTTLTKLLKSRGGKYRGQADEQVMFNLYTNVVFVAMPPDRRGLSVELSFDTPPGRARQSSPKSRMSFWEGVSGKRLIQGGLVALLWQSGTDIHVYLATIASNLKSLTESAGRSGGDSRVTIRVAFFSPDIELRALNALKNRDLAETGLKLLIEAPVMFEAIRPFLEALRREPESLPFAEYLVHRHNDFFVSRSITPPQYALVPGFKFELASLFPPEAAVASLELDVSSRTSIMNAREQLRTASRLDPSQADAVIDTMVRELSLIQGPPGTGKSFTGVEILRVLLANKIGPILMIAFTNHALDHLLTSVLDAGITNNIVRLGSRSADERISQFSLETLEFAAGRSRLHNSFKNHYHDLKKVQEKIDKLMKAYINATVPTDELKKHLEFGYPEHCEHLYMCPPDFVRELLASDEGEGGDWEHVNKQGKVETEDKSIYAFWQQGRDLSYIEASIVEQSKRQREVEKQSRNNRFDILADMDAEEQHERVPELEDDSGIDDDEDVEDIKELWEQDWLSLPSESSIREAASTPAAGNDDENGNPSPTEPLSPRTVQMPLLDQTPEIVTPTRNFLSRQVLNSDRPLAHLLSEGTMWSFSRRERNRLHEFWSREIREQLDINRLEEFEALRREYETILKNNQESQDEIRRTLLQSRDIVGCTTTGAAKLTSLLQACCSLAPRVMLVEEAGQVLEAHILGSLVPSIEHLILIGDPLQLRPTLNNYSLSMDNRRGRELFKFDMSLMERLSSNNLAMSQINVQRRMRPEISSLIRNTLYPSLEDHSLVKSYPPVRGFAKNVFFFNHSHRENDGGEESSSKYNTFEVEMIKDLVLHLLRQGCYSDEGDIVVLCAYLGQLARVRDALAGLKEIAVLIEGKDQQDLAEQEEELDDHGHIEHVKVTKRVRLRTIDNYQGEEAEIVILSTVRNVGSQEDSSHMHGRPTIGFLASENRTNGDAVALSRAKQGLFILGNSAQLSSRSKMWREVIEQLESVECVGDAFPVSCHRHPETIKMISQPGKITLFAPDGLFNLLRLVKLANLYRGLSRTMCLSPKVWSLVSIQGIYNTSLVQVSRLTITNSAIPMTQNTSQSNAQSPALAFVRVDTPARKSVHRIVVTVDSWFEMFSFHVVIDLQQLNVGEWTICQMSDALKLC
ncbi:hypothetical protein MIND_00058100 [Mycena indigotica]|uniref:C3H1-type domain-containing protein n=1 Tax=Mycena indigotica TaxID=2126181 RepID=A0A8H6TEW4_9AGAR|nr:uncharacterized protein MIND_00058100 [Mycena indigotica]KAF7315432.1 hypothetical protein MIND_00058100 [Mycena indigotica]